jgi:tetratricopeptide (TPR) repeat protein
LDEFAHHPIEEPALAPQMLVDRQVKEKVFLVGIDHRDGQYEVSCRHLDGRTQQVGPIRRRTTADRFWVSKAVCLAVKNDFLPVAAITPGQEKYTVAIQFQGAAHKDQLHALLGEDCILQPFWVIKKRDGGVYRAPIPYTVLRVKPKENLGRATVISNLPQPWKRTASVVGFEAIKLNTQRGQLRLKLVDAATGDAALGCFVSANDRGFEELGPGDELGKPDPAGQIISRNYDHLAFVQITQGGAPPLRIPAPITESLCEQVVKLTVDPDAGAKSDFDRELRFLVQDVRTLKAVQDSGVEESNELSGAKRYEDAVRRVQEAIDAVTPLAGAAESSLNRLATEADKIAQSDKPLLKWVTGQVKEVRDRQAELEKLVASLNNAIAQRNAQANADRLKEQARQAEQEVDIDEAITRYELALAEQPDQPLLRKYLDDLKEAWRIKNPAHEQARKLVNERWANAEVTELEQLLPQVKAALDTLKKEQDRYGMLRLMKINDQHLAAVVDVVQQADARGGEADLEESKKYAAFVDEIANFNEEVAQAASAAPGPGSAPPSNSAPPENAPSQDGTPSTAPPTNTAPSGGTPPPVNLPPEKEEEPL